MMRRVVLALAAAAAMAAPAQAADPIREFPIATIETLGQAIHRQDSAAWVATDALMAKVHNPGGEGLVGWIVVDAGANQKVRFLRKAGSKLEAGYDVDITPDLKATVSVPGDRALTDEEVAMFAARQTAAAGLAGQAVCRPRYNAVVLKDPEQPGWLVWLLAPVAADKAYPVGGHYRFTISADGRRIRRRDALSASCMTLDPNEMGVPAGSAPAGFFLTHIVSSTPVETHVFVNLQSQIPIYLGAGGRMWSVESGRITDRGPLASK